MYGNKIVKNKFFRFFPENKTRTKSFITWGRKNIKYPNNIICLEDGFIHSLGQGVLKSQACSMVVDHIGIYYDATVPSYLENIILNTVAIDDLKIKQFIRTIIDNDISKYNNAPFELKKNLPDGEKILVVDQTYGDMSLQYGYANSLTFNAMVEAALNENPTAHIIVKTHPDVIVGKKKGCINLQQKNSRIIILSEPINTMRLLKKIDKVYVATSQLGFEALMLNKPVVCFGVPFYAGWGLTDDRASPNLAVFKRRNKKCSVTEIFQAAYIDYTRYIHPDTNQCCKLADIIEYFSLQNYLFKKNANDVYILGQSFAFWKKNYLKKYFQSPKNKIIFLNSVNSAEKLGFSAGSQLYTWGQRKIEDAQGLTTTFNVKLGHIEDGFIRSVGLGSDLTPPLSLVVDKTGIYYDPTQPSDLESLLETYEFTDELIMRAANIKKMLLENAVSKYNVGKKLVSNLVQNQAGQRIILIPGQVEDDASIQKGCVDIKTNAELIQQVRLTNPSAYLVYKPHPDVISGNRIGKVDRSITDQYCDLVLEDSSITDCLDIADEVHTMTSLVGFEGLLRHKKVVCYGIPFYANWGLTEDRHTVGRRTRRLTLDELVAATLILYPRYMNWETGAFTTPEFAIETLRKQIDALGGKPINKISWLHRQVRKMKHFYKGVFAKP